MKDKSTTLGKLAYDEYCQARDWKSVRGEPLPQFDQQAPELKIAWEKAAYVVALKIKEMITETLSNEFGVR